ncbi:phage head closure protein [Symbiopectobacterium sp. RP]|uniref:phage head closure protein n=1 Tax=Symbiopectobacterium sp. RP TaxID=3248553 RepID=UPI003D2E0E06
MSRSFDINARYRFPDIGELNKRVLFRKHRDEPTGEAELKDVYTDEYTTWGKVSPVGETIRIGSVQINDVITHRVIVRYRKQLYKSNQIVVDDCIYNIKGVIDVNSARRFLAFSCEEQSEEKVNRRKFGGFGYQNDGVGAFE